MTILCGLVGHTPMPDAIWNEGYYFTRCGCCDCEMIGRAGAWRRVPRGYRVVWRPRKGRQTDWTPYRAGQEAARS